MIVHIAHLLKPLQWNKQNDGTEYANPHGLRWMYYITRLNNQFELALIDNNGDWDHDMLIYYTAIMDAKQTANNHYMKVITYHINNAILNC